MCNRLSILCTLIAVLMLIAVGASEAAILGSYHGKGSGGSRSVDTVWLSYVSFGDRHYELFDDTPLIANIGKTLWISSDQQDRDFSKAVAYLTNGANDSFEMMVGTRYASWGIPIDERKAFFSGTGGPDFAGQNVGAIGVMINGATATSPGENPNHDGIWTDYTYDLTLLVATGVPVPEPASMLVLASLITGFCIRRHRISAS